MCRQGKLIGFAVETGICESSRHIVIYHPGSGYTAIVAMTMRTNAVFALLFRSGNFIGRFEASCYLGNFAVRCIWRALSCISDVHPHDKKHEG
ncbi:hypothetical protein A8B75_17115 [Sphingomonadales bacterium EhC05]|nr:hypothetical protein A8B75_17115 [Sphingomonadales bacterium EhC05]